MLGGVPEASVSLKNEGCVLWIVGVYKLHEANRLSKAWDVIPYLFFSPPDVR